MLYKKDMTQASDQVNICFGLYNIGMRSIFEGLVTLKVGRFGLQ